MWRLPQLEWNDRHWQLSLDDDAAASLVVALLSPKETRSERVAGVIAGSPTLAAWIVCSSNQWKHVPPATFDELAEWLVETAIPTRQFTVELVPADPRAMPLEPGSADEAPPDSSSSSAKPLSVIWYGLQQVREDGATAGSSERLSGCPWLPEWSRDAASVGDGEQLATEPPRKLDPGIISTAALLPAVLNQLRQLQRLEQSFAAELEQEKLAAMRELAYGASHEINNPLANIATRAQTLLRDERDLEKRRVLAIIAAQAFRAHEMIADMMLFAKPPAPQFQPTDLHEVVRIAVKEVSTDARGQETTLQCNLADHAISAHVDPTQLGIAVKALLRNALEALGAGGTIAITVAPGLEGNQEWTEIMVQDSGPGILPDVRRHLFDPFYSGREAGRGLGFGLAKVWRIMELHGGSVDCESEPGFGAKFRLRFPRSNGATN